jgi:uncharacterized protein YqeY
MLHEEIKNQIKEAMRAKDAVRLEVLRGMVTAFTNDLVAKGKKPQDFLADDEALAVITRLSKQRKDSIDQYTKGGREDLVAEEKAQLAVIETFLPKLMDKADIEVVAKKIQSDLGMTDPTKKGMFMAAVMKELKGKADGAIVKEVVDSLF